MPTKTRPVIVNRREAWHFDKKLSLDTLVAIVGIAVVIGGPLIFAWRSMESRILVIETIQSVQQRQFEQLLSEERERRGVFATQMKDLGDVLTALRLDVARLTNAPPQQAMPSVRSMK